MKYDINLFIGDKEVEFSSDPRILFNFKETELHNPTIVRNSFTKTIEIEGTNTNNDIFGHIWDLDRYQYYGSMEDGASFNPIKKVPFKLFVGGDLYQRGYVKLDKVRKRNNTMTYSITLYGGLGDFFYNLSYDQDGEGKKTLADLKFTTNDGETHPDLDFVINKDAINDAWNHINRTISQYEPRWEVINFIPAYEGKPNDFSSDKVLINTNGIDIFERSKTDGGLTYQPILNGSPNASGYCLGTASEEMTEWETFDLRSYNQRPVVSMYRIIQACCQPENNGGYQVKLDDHFFDYNNPYYSQAWMTLPMLKDTEQNKIETENVTGATLSLSDPTHYSVNYNTTTLTSLNNIKMRMGVTFTPQTSTSANRLYTQREWKSTGGVTVVPNEFVKKYRYNAGVILQLQAYDTDGNLAGASKRYVLSGDKYYPNSNDALDFWVDRSDIGESGYTQAGVEYLTGDWIKSGSTYTFCDFNGRPVDIDFSLTSSANISRLVVKMNTTYGDNINYKVFGRSWRDVRQDASTATYLYTSKSGSGGGNRRRSEVRTIDGVLGQFGIRMSSFEAQAYDYEALYSGTKVSGSRLLGGDKTPADYLINYCKMFGLYFYQDTTEDSDNPEKYPSGVIHIMDRDTFYTDEFVDLSKCIDYSRDINITPAMANAKWYKFEMEQVDSQAESEYKNTYNRVYGSQLVNTNYNFDNNTTDLFDGTVFKAGIQVWEKDKYFKMPTEGVPNYAFNGLKYELFNQSGGEFNSTELNQVIQTTDGWNNINRYGLDYYDVFPKLQLHNSENEGIDGDGVLVFYVSGITAQATYTITDDVYDMAILNGGDPCWLMTNSEFDANGNRIAYKTSILPYFTRDLFRYSQQGNIVNSWNFGHPQATFAPDTYSTENDCIYDKCWKNYINDLYDTNSRKLTCYADINLDGKPWPYWFRRWYWFENSIWRLNEIKDLNMASFDVTQMEFIKVQDVNNYKLNKIYYWGQDELVIIPEQVSWSAQTVNGYVISQSGSRWAMADHFYSTDTVTSAETYYECAQYIRPLAGSGYRTDFTVQIPANTGSTPLEWTVLAETSDDVWIRDKFIQMPETVTPALIINPATMDVAASSTTAQYTYTIIDTVNDIGVMTDSDWVTATLSGNTINVRFTANTGSSRTATITLSGTSATGNVYTTATLVQAGEAAYELVITRPSNAVRNVSSDADDWNAWWEFKAVNVSNLGAIIEEGSDWITRVEIEEDPTPVSGSTHLLIAYHTANTGQQREGQIQITGWTGTGGIATFATLVQASGGSEEYTFLIYPQTARNETSAATDTWFGVTLANVNDFGVEVTSGSDWLTAAKTTEGAGDYTWKVNCNFSQNTGAQRSATLTFSGRTGGGTVLTETRNVLQAAGSSTYEFRWINPSSGNRIVSSGITSTNMKLRAVGVTNLGAEITSGASWLNSLTFTESALTDGTTHIATLSFNQNEGVQRTGTIHISGTTASAGNVSLIGNITQEKGQGETPEIIITTSPRTVGYKSGSASFYYTIKGNVSGLTVNTGNASPWCTASIASGGGYIIVSYTQNNLTGSTSTRTATITISGNGGAVEDTVTLTQYGSNLSITPTTVYLDYPVNSSKPITVTSNNPWEITDIRDE